MPPGLIRLSKSRVMAGLQCHKRLWWTVHEPTAPELEPDEALQGGAPVIYEASFRASQVFVSVDILERRRESTTVIEVKSTTRAKEQHLADVAVQAHVLRRSGIEASRLEIMHLNRACAYPDLSNLFIRTDVTQEAHDALEAAPA